MSQHFQNQFPDEHSYNKYWTGDLTVRECLSGINPTRPRADEHLPNLEGLQLYQTRVLTDVILQALVEHLIGQGASLFDLQEKYKLVQTDRAELDEVAKELGLKTRSTQQLPPADAIALTSKFINHRMVITSTDLCNDHAIHEYLKELEQGKTVEHPCVVELRRVMTDCDVPDLIGLVTAPTKSWESALDKTERKTRGKEDRKPRALAETAQSRRQESREKTVADAGIMDLVRATVLPQTVRLRSRLLDRLNSYAIEEEIDPTLQRKDLLRRPSQISDGGYPQTKVNMALDKDIHSKSRRFRGVPSEIVFTSPEQFKAKKEHTDDIYQFVRRFFVGPDKQIDYLAIPDQSLPDMQLEYAKSLRKHQSSLPVDHPRRRRVPDLLEAWNASNTAEERDRLKVEALHTMRTDLNDVHIGIHADTARKSQDPDWQREWICDAMRMNAAHGQQTGGTQPAPFSEGHLLLAAGGNQALLNELRSDVEKDMAQNGRVKSRTRN